MLGRDPQASSDCQRGSWQQEGWEASVYMNEIPNFSMGGQDSENVMHYLRSQGTAGIKRGILPGPRGLLAPQSWSRCQGISSFVLFSKPFDYDEGQLSVLCLHFPSLWCPSSHLSFPGGGGERWLFPAGLAPRSHNITKHVALRYLRGSTERIENLSLVAWPSFNGGILGSIDSPVIAGEIFQPSPWTLLN